MFVVFLCIVLMHCICTSDFTEEWVFGVFDIVICFADVVFVIFIVAFIRSSGFRWSSFESGESFVIIIIVDLVCNAMGVKGVSSLVS